ncbi:50S ribosomal protein L5 [Patescibacteria group bacterium]|nr:50S ribosomal protein L5 [Patescibacteria group bacterium]
MSNLFKYYQEEGRKILAKDLGIGNIMMVPKLVKIVVNIGLGEALTDKKVLEVAAGQLSQITGQKPSIRRAKHDISSFKLRQGDAVGLKVTLRGRMMYDFCEKLVKIVLPRIRDFRGVPDTGFDKEGNFTLGLSEQIVFPEIEYSQVDKIRGLEMTFVISGKGKKEARRLLEVLGMPFKKPVAAKRAEGK